MKLKKGMRSLLVFSLLAALLVPLAAFAAETDATAQIPVTVNVAEGTPAGTEFKVTLTANDKKNPMPKETAMIATAKDSEDQDESFDGSFGPITYTTPGNYYYTVTQEEGNTDKVVYDTTTYTVLVSVANQDDASGNYIGLKTAVSAWEGTKADKPEADQKLSEITFDNDYQTSEPTTTEKKTTTEPTDGSTTKKTTNTTTKKSKSTKTGDNSNILFWTTLAVVAAAACVMLMIADQKRRSSKK